MRLAARGIIALALTSALAACEAPGTPMASVRLDPEQTAERALTGGTLGAALGAGLGATGSINPLLGASIGAQAGAVVGGAIGVITTPPLPSYQPVAVPAEAVLPSFYDNWPPGFYRPPDNPETLPANPG